MKKRNFAILAALLSLIVAFMVVSCEEPSSGGDDTTHSPKATVTSVIVSAAGNATSVNKGEPLQFSAVVKGANSPSQAVTWSISTAGKKASTTISTGGLLTVAGDEALPLTVCATSTVDPNQSGTATVIVKDSTLNDLTGDVSITANGSPVTTVTAGTQLTANYSGDDNVTYQWSKNGYAISGETAQTYTPSANGSYTVMVSLSGYNPKISTVVTVTGENPPETWPTEERWFKYVNEESTATLEYSVDNEGVCEIIVGGEPMPQDPDNNNWGRWRVNANYTYTAKANTSYIYEFEAWTQSGNRDLQIQYYFDAAAEQVQGSGWLMFYEQPITEIRTTYRLAGERIPKGGLHRLEFHCADKTGTFYVKVKSITETSQTPSQLNDWWKWDDASTAKLAYSIDGDGTCNITVSGTPAEERWHAHVGRSYAPQMNKSYIYEIIAWTDSGERTFNFSYHEDNDAEIYKGKDITIDSQRRLYTVYGEKIPTSVQTPGLRFQCADQTGTFHVRILSITEYEPGTLTINNFSNSSGSSGINGYANLGNSEWLDFGDWQRSGNTVTFNVYKVENGEWIPFTGNVTVTANNLWINADKDGVSYRYKNTTSISFVKGKATINFSSQMSLDSVEKELGTLIITNFSSISGFTEIYGHANLGNDEWLNFDHVQTIGGSNVIFKVRYGGNNVTPVFTGTGNVPAGDLRINVYGNDGSEQYTNTAPIDFKNGSAAINFGNDMVLQSVREKLGTLIIINFSNVHSFTGDIWFYGYASFENNDEWLNLSFDNAQIASNILTLDVWYNNASPSLTGYVTVPIDSLWIRINGENGSAEYRNKSAVTFTDGIATINFSSMELSSFRERIGTLTINNFSDIHNFTGNIWASGNANFENEGGGLNFESMQINGNVVTFDVWYSDSPTIIRNGTVAEGNLWINVNSNNASATYRNTTPITFNNGSATVPFSDFTDGDIGGGGGWDEGDG